MNRKLGVIACVAASLSLLTPALAQPPVPYPSKGQGPKTQAKDESECRTWAINKSGFDPATPPPPKAQAAGATGSGAGVKGAAVGAGVGAISGGDAGQAAVAGAVAGRVIKRNKNRQAAAQTNEMNAQAYAAAQGSYNQAWSACLSGRGYSVR